MSHIIFNVFCVVLVLLVSYLLGCFNGSVVISHFIIKDDVRSHGSGNAGLTNFYRTYGAKYALGVIALDMGKTVVAGLIGGYLFWFLRQDWTLGLLLAGIGCELGHMFPAFYGFKGGKGILCGGHAGVDAGLESGTCGMGPVRGVVVAEQVRVPGLHLRRYQPDGVRVPVLRP